MFVMCSRHDLHGCSGRPSTHGAKHTPTYGWTLPGRRQAGAAITYCGGSTTATHEHRHQGHVRHIPLQIQIMPGTRGASSEMPLTTHQPTARMMMILTMMVDDDDAASHSLH